MKSLTQEQYDKAVAALETWWMHGLEHTKEVADETNDPSGELTIGVRVAGLSMHFVIIGKGGQKACIYNITPLWYNGISKDDIDTLDSITKSLNNHLTEQGVWS